MISDPVAFTRGSRRRRGYQRLRFLGSRHFPIDDYAVSLSFFAGALTSALD